MSTEYYRDLLRPHFEGRKFILIGSPVVGFADMIAQLRSLGAERPLIIGSTLGTGTPPSEDEALWHSLDVRGSDVMDSFYRYEALLRDLPPEAREQVERYDPERTARVLGAIVSYDHVATSAGSGSEILFILEATGPTAPLVARFLKPAYERALDEAVPKLRAMLAANAG
jgi:hypothetical protein